MNIFSYLISYYIDWSFLNWPLWAEIKFWLWVATAILGAIFAYLFIRVLSLLSQPWPTSKSEEAAPTTALETQMQFEGEWLRIKNYLASPNTADWKLAILEADTVLNDILEEQKYPGETLGERLTHITAKELSTIDAAWEAHKVRNQIAHEGQAFQLSKAEAERLLHLYEQVFREIGNLPVPAEPA